MPTYREVLSINEQYALDNQKEDSGVKLLLLHFAKIDSAELLISLDEEMPEAKYQDFLYGVDRYITKNIPVQHIIGFQEFYGYDFIVNKDVLIPRFETEELLGNILIYTEEVFGTEDIHVADIGTGSGCLAITLDLEETNMTVIGTDISERALDVARINNESLGANVKFIKGDMLEPLIGMKFDVLVSNPPYIPNKEFVEGLIKDNEPNVALFGGEDGLEHAFNKAKELKKLIRKHLKDVEIIQKKDLQGKDRMTFIIKR